MTEDAAPPPRRRWILGSRGAALALLVLLWVELWALAAADPDFYLPDLLRPLAIAVIVVFLVTGLLTGWPRLRRLLRGAILFLVVSVLLLECFATRAEVLADHIEVSDDALLRYHYRPGAHVSSGPEHLAMNINSAGLWDLEYAVPKPPGVYRVILIGGSMGNDGDVRFAERYHVLLQERLADAPAGVRVETVNVSCEGYNTLQQVRLLEQVGLRYQPDLVIVAYQLSDPFLQNGAGRRVGNSAYLFRLALPLRAWFAGSKCSIFAPLYDRYGFHLAVREPLERLKMIGEREGFTAMVAVLPLLERFEDPICVSLYEQVAAVAEGEGMTAIRVAADAFAGEPVERYVKEESPGDLAHLNAAGHRKVAELLAARVRAHLEATLPTDDGATSANATKVATEDDPSGPPASCRDGHPGADHQCGDDRARDCCESREVPGGAFLRVHDGVTCTNDAYPATVSPFALDTFEVTVGRFRAFLDAGYGTQEQPPAPDAGAHPGVPESGWDPSWNSQLAIDRAALTGALACGLAPTFTAEPGDHEALPINCLTFYEALAFCAWDGGFLPSEAERAYAAAGGDEQRLYPWSNPPAAATIESRHAVFAAAGAAPVGSRSPDGDGRWGHADLAGNLWEWTIDRAPSAELLPTEGAYPCAAAGLPRPCVDCVGREGDARVLLGGGWGLPARGMATGIRRGGGPGDREHVFGVRCARAIRGAHAAIDLQVGARLPALSLRGLARGADDPEVMTPLRLGAGEDDPRPALRALTRAAAPPKRLAIFLTRESLGPPPVAALTALEGALEGADAALITVLVEGARRGQIADAGNVRAWALAGPLRLPVFMDERGGVAEAIGDLPALVLVDLESMQVQRILRGAAALDPGEAIHGLTAADPRGAAGRSADR